MTPHQVVGLVLVAKQAENPKDPVVWPFLATLFWSAVCIFIATAILPTHNADTWVYHVVAWLFIVTNNWAFWRAYFVAKQKKELE